VAQVQNVTNLVCISWHWSPYSVKIVKVLLIVPVDQRRQHFGLEN